MTYYEFWSVIYIVKQLGGVTGSVGPQAGTQTQGCSKNKASTHGMLAYRLSLTMAPLFTVWVWAWTYLTRWEQALRLSGEGALPSSVGHVTFKW